MQPDTDVRKLRTRGSLDHAGRPLSNVSIFLDPNLTAMRLSDKRRSVSNETEIYVFQMERRISNPVRKSFQMEQRLTYRIILESRSG